MRPPSGSSGRHPHVSMSRSKWPRGSPCPISPGRACFRSGAFEEARAEFEAVVERAPTNDYALFCLGRSLMMLGRAAEARKPLTLAANMNPKRRDYRIYRDRARKAA